MPFNGSGVFQRVRNWVADATAGVKIRADYHDDEDNGFAAGLTNCITKDGQTVVTQNIPMNSKRITGLADPINPQDASTKAYTDTKMPLAGGTFTGPVTINGAVSITGTVSVANTVAANGYQTRTGLAGSFGGNWFNINWTGATADLWVNDTNTGTLATQAYVNAGDNVLLHRAGDTMYGPLISTTSFGVGNGGSAGTFEVRGLDSANSCAMTFHIPSLFAANFGLASDGNFYMGGYSHGAGVVHKFWTTRDFGTPPVTLEHFDARLAELVARIEALEAKGG